MKIIHVLVFLPAMICITSCNKELSSPDEPGGKEVPPHLTERLWLLDTILLDSVSYDDLTGDQQFSYDAILGWTAGAELTFRNDDSVICSGDWDFGYNHWQLINNKKDIKVTLASGYDTLRAWQATETRFTYVQTIGAGGANAFNCIYVYK